MDSKDIEKLLEGVQMYGELVGGLKKQFMAQGFSEENSELMVIEILKKVR